MKIAIAGAGYVGLSLGTLFSVKNEVTILDIIPEKVDMINNRISPIEDKDITEYFLNKKLNLKATLDYKEAFKDAEYIIISTPTDYNPEIGSFDTKSVEDIIEKVISLNLETTIIIKSTVPVGYTENIRKKYNTKNIIFSPEFLREGSALYDNLYPSRIIVGDKSEKGKEFGELLKENSLKKDVVVKYMNSTEAESVKLFSNTYLALRVAYFNELDTYAELNGLNTKDIIDGVCLDSRIGAHYNNPSFGYGGYCLPKDTKQLLANYSGAPQNIIEAIVRSNDTRKEHIANIIAQHNPKLVGAYRLSMKRGSLNSRSSSIIDVIKILKSKGIEIIIYEPNIKEKEFMGFEIINDIEEFKNKSTLIIANRKDKNIEDVESKVYTRDIYFEEEYSGKSHNMKTYLVTGGAGFIGSTLIERLLKENNKVICIDNFCNFYDSKIKEKNIKDFTGNSNFVLYREDIRNKEGIKKIFNNNKIDCVIHLAAMAGVRPSIDNPILYHEVNVMGTLNILENMKEHNIKDFILASSSSVYGNVKEVPFREDMIVDYPISPYASTKKEDEVLSHVYHELYDINTIALRFFTVYGPKQRPDLAISKFTRLMLNNEEIPMYGDGNTFRDYTYIDDIVDGIIKSITYLENNKNVYEIINLGSSNPISLKRMINVIGEELNIEPKIKVMNNQLGDVEKTYADITKAKRLINYEPKTSFESGIKKFLEWYNQSINSIKLDASSNYITKEEREKIYNLEKKVALERMFRMDKYTEEELQKNKQLNLKFKKK